MRSDRSSAISSLSSILLVGLMICTFVFYGVVGEDKTWLVGPAITLNMVLVCIVMISRASQSSVLNPLSSVPRLPISTLLWILFVIYGALMISQATVPFESKLVMLFIGAVVGAYLVWGAELTTFKDNRLLLGFLIMVVMILALYGLIIHFRSPDSILWTERYTTDAYEGRLRSTYICPNHFAHLMQMLLPFCVALLFIPQSGLFLRLLCAYSFVAFLPPLFLTESRAGWLGSIAATGVTLCLIAFRKSKKLFLFLVLLVPLCSTLLLFAGWRFSETFQRRATPVVQFLQGQAEGGVGSEAKDFRPQTWMDTIDMIKEAPLIGFGPGNYHYTYPEHRKRFSHARIVTGHPHNEYLELIADYGLIGFILFSLAWCYGLIRILIASLKAEETRHAFIGFAFLGTAAGTMVHSFFDFEMHVFPNAMVFALLAAMAWGPLAAKRKKRSQRTLRPDSGQATGEDQSPIANNQKPSPASLCPLWLTQCFSWLIAIGYLALTLFCIQVMGSSFIRAMGDKRAEALGIGRLASGDERVANLYALAARIDPQNWRAYKGMTDLIYNQRYYSLDMAEKVALAEKECRWYAKAYRTNPKDPGICMPYGKCLIFLGRSAVSHKSLAISSEPSSSGNSARENGFSTSEQQIERGLDLLREACKYRPFNDIPWWNLGVELRKLGRYKEALDVFNKARSIRRSKTTIANIKWIEAMLRATGDGLQATGDGHQTAVDGRQATDDGRPEGGGESWELPDPADAEADPELMDLFEKMSE